MYDLAIIGAGPAGLSASIYASRYGIKNKVFGGIVGGLMTETHEIGNWLGTEKIAGFEFAMNAEKHARALGADIAPVQVTDIKKNKDSFTLTLSNGESEEARTILLATGTKHRHLGVPGEKEFAGKGVSYCATCDGYFFKEKTVGIVGGNNSAAAAAVHLGGIAKKVYVIYRRDKLRAEDYWVKLIEKNEKIEIINNANVVKIFGKEKLEKVELDNEFNSSNEMDLDGLFIEIGLDPKTKLAEVLGAELDDGYIKIDASGATSVSGVWAAGDITTGSNGFNQIVTAAAEGAIASQGILNYLK